MRLIPFLTALLVVAGFYMLIFEREALLAFAQADGAEPDAEATAPADAPRRVSVVALRSEAQSIDNALILRGQTEAARQVEVRAETSGLVISEPLRKGAMVSAGDVLCELDPGTRQASLDEAVARLAEARARVPEAQARVPEARARLAEAQARVAETEARLAEARARLQEAEINQNAAIRLGEDGFASETRVANAEAALESARAGVVSAEAAVEGTRAQIAGAEAGVEGAVAGVEGVRAAIQSAEAAVAAAEREMERLTITAPFDGLLETDSAELGALLQPGGNCATVIQLDPIRLVGFIPETNVGQISTGALAGARLASGREVQGQVTFISRSADPTTRTFRVEITVANEDLTIRDGQTAEILVQAEGTVAHLLPQSALTLDDEGALGVRIVTGADTAGFMPVRLIRDTVEGVWVDGLPQQARVIVVGQEFVDEGVALRVQWRGEEVQGAAMETEGEASQ